MMNEHAQTKCKRKVAQLIGRPGLIALAVSLFSTITWAAEPVKINSLLTYPESYNMKMVRVEGTVSGYHMNHFIGNSTKLEKCIQEFSVEDDTGTINASYATICQMGTVMLKDGDHVTIDAHFSGILDVRSVAKN
ncbi:MAG: hypothetical protein HY038_06605 [Nitrospirae bacterium]|nr:hypothetical protein [Nitrospirota bacterium]